MTTTAAALEGPGADSRPLRPTTTEEAPCCDPSGESPHHHRRVGMSRPTTSDDAGDGAVVSEAFTRQGVLTSRPDSR